MAKLHAGVADDEADVIVVGLGMGGVAAAIEAAERGASVLALDATSGGGTTEISGGVIYAGGGTSIQKAAGVADDVEQLYRYLRTEVHEAVTDETLRRFCEQSPGSVDWLRDRGVPFGTEVCPFKTSYPNNRYYLYYSGSEGSAAAAAVATPAPRGHRTLGKGTSGRALMPPLIAHAEQVGVRVRRLTKVVDLVRDESGRVVGVEVSTLAGAPVRVRRRYARLAALSAKPGVYSPQLRAPLEKLLRRIERRHARPAVLRACRGVVLATGGFIANRGMIREYAPECRKGLPLGTAHDDGLGITLGSAAGGALGHMGRVSVWRFISPPSAMGGALFVGPDGTRSVDESRYGAALGDALVHVNGGRGWLLADAHLVAAARRQLRTEPLWFQRLQAESMMRIGARTADTVAELAVAAGIDPEGLQRTVDAHNAAIAAGRPDPVGKGDTVRRPLVKAPFSLFEVSVVSRRSTAVIPDTNPCPMLTLGGLRVDETSGAVLRRTGGGAVPVGTPAQVRGAGEPVDGVVAGLYAAGRAAVGVCSDNYISGLSIADALFSGRRAGAAVAGAGHGGV